MIQSLVTLGGRRSTLNFLSISLPSFSANAPNSSSLSIFCKVILMIPDKTSLCSEHCLKKSMHLCKTRSGHNMFLFLLKRRIKCDSYIPLLVFSKNGPIQNARSLLTPGSDTDFYTLSCGTSLHFVLHGSIKNHLFQRF